MRIRFVAAMAAAVLILGAGIWFFHGRPSVPSSSQEGTAESERPQAGPASPAETVAAEPPWFADVTAETGIDFRHQSGDSPEKPFPSANGSGLAALDYDLDGRIDLYFVAGCPFPVDPSQQAHRNRIYRNGGRWRFEDVTDRCGLGHNGYSHGVAVGDFDSDGFPDVYVTCYGANRLFHNRGDGTFGQVAEAAGVADQRWGSSGAFLDYDDDGMLDLYVTNYAKWSLETNAYCGDRERGIRLFCSPRSVPPETDILYRNAGDGTFHDATAEAGVGARIGRALGVLAAQLDDDRRIDLFVANDLNANSLFLNEGNGRFRDASELSGCAYDGVGRIMSSMGLDAADTTGSGRFDVLVTHFQNEFNILYVNHGGGLFQDLSELNGTGAPSLPFVGWGVLFSDFDLDGWSDALVTNGHVDDNRQEVGESVTLTQHPLLYHNRQGRFVALGAVAGPYFSALHQGRGLTLADLDNDGDMDGIFNHRDEPAAVLRNDRGYPHSGSRRSVLLRLVGTRGNRDAVGAVVRLHAGQRTKVEQIMGGGGYQSARDPRLLFAVDTAENSLQFEIDWPGGARSTLSDCRPGGSYVVVEPADGSTSAGVFPEELP